MTGMDGKEDVILEKTANHKETLSTSALSLTARESGITTVPIAILEALFDKAATVVSTPGSVVPKPGASDGFFMVAGVSNKVHSVTPGKGGSLRCDSNCINRSTKTREHTLAFAQLNGTLQEFVTSYKRSKRGPNLTSMAAAGGPKKAGRKPSKGKGSNPKTQPVLQHIDLLQHNPDELPPDGLGNPEAIGGQFNIAASSVPLQSSSHYSAPSGPLQRRSQYNVSNVVLQSCSHCNVPSVPIQSSSQNSALSGLLQRSSHYNVPSAVLQSNSHYSARHLFLFKAAVNMPLHLMLFKAVVSKASVIFPPLKFKVRRTTLLHNRLAHLLTRVLFNAVFMAFH